MLNGSVVQLDSSRPGSSVHGISQARILEWDLIYIFKLLWLILLWRPLGYSSKQPEGPRKKRMSKTRFWFSLPWGSNSLTYRSIQTLNRTVDPSPLKGTPLDNISQKGLKIGNQGWRGDTFISVNSPLARMKYTRWHNGNSWREEIYGKRDS